MTNVGGSFRAVGDEGRRYSGTGGRCRRLVRAAAAGERLRGVLSIPECSPKSSSKNAAFRI